MTDLYSVEKLEIGRHVEHIVVYFQNIHDEMVDLYLVEKMISTYIMCIGKV